MTNQAANCGNITSGLGANSFPARQLNQALVALNTATHKELTVLTAAWKDTLLTQGTTPSGKTTVRKTHRLKVENRKVPRGITVAGNGNGCRVVAGIKPGPSEAISELTPSGTLPIAQPDGTCRGISSPRSALHTVLAPASTWASAFYSEAA